MSKTVWISHSIDAWDLAEEICDNLNGGVLDFIMHMDACMADTSFTEELIEKLSKSLAKVDY